MTIPTTKHLRALVLSVLVLASLSMVSASILTAKAATASAPNLHVSGNQLLDANNQPIFLHGVNYSGGEYACVQNFGIFDGPSDQAFVSTLVASHINMVRLPMNEDCWLGINGMPAAFSGANYQTAFVAFANLLVANGITPELDLQWSAPGATKATNTNSMPDADHSVAFWSQVAAKFAGRSDVVFDLYNEPHPNGGWNIWQQGGQDNGFQTAGMQSLVSAVRAANFSGVLSLSGIDYANTLGGTTGWISHKPNDVSHNLVAAVHVYVGNTHQSPTAWASDFAATAAVAPLLNNELGSYRFDDAGGLQPAFAQSFWTWLQSVHGVGTMAWTWNTWGTVEALVSGFSGPSLTTWGQEVVSFYASLSSGGGTPPTPTPTTPPTPPTPTPTSVPPTPTPAPSGNNLALVQAASAFIDYSGVNPTGVDLTKPVQAGDLLVTIVAVAGGNPYTVDHITDDLGNTWQKAISGVNGDETDVEIWYTNSATSGADGAYATLVRGTGGNSVFAQSYTTLAEFHGGGTFHAGHASASNGTSSHGSGSFAGTTGDLIVGGYADAGYVGTIASADGKHTLGVPFTGIDAIQGFDSYGVSGGSGAQADAVSYSNNHFSRAEVAGASFTPSGGTPPPPPPPPPTPFQNAPCTILLNGSTLTGTCTGTIVLPS